jgi:hypothetical protein
MFARFGRPGSVTSPMRMRIPVVGVGLTALVEAANG